MGAEKQIEQYARDAAKKLGVLFRKNVSPATRGVADRYFIYDRQIVFAEFKAPGKRPTPLQQARLDELVEEGMHAVVIDSRHVVDEVLEGLTLHRFML